MRPNLGKMRPIWAICTKNGQKCPRIGKKFNHRKDCLLTLLCKIFFDLQAWGGFKMPDDECLAALCSAKYFSFAEGSQFIFWHTYIFTAFRWAGCSAHAASTFTWTMMFSQRVKQVIKGSSLLNTLPFSLAVKLPTVFNPSLQNEITEGSIPSLALSIEAQRL